MFLLNNPGLLLLSKCVKNKARRTVLHHIDSNKLQPVIHKILADACCETKHIFTSIRNHTPLSAPFINRDLPITSYKQRHLKQKEGYQFKYDKTWVWITFASVPDDLTILSDVWDVLIQLFAPLSFLCVCLFYVMLL